MEKPLVSILMSVYNGEKFIKEAIESVLAQTYPYWELIIVDDDSTDQTSDIIHSYDDERIRYHKIVKSSDLATVRNESINLAKGEYSAILDSDDVAFPHKLERQVDFMKKNPQYGICGSWATCLGKEWNFKMFTEHDVIKCSTIFQSPFIHSTVFIRTDLLKEMRYHYGFAFAEDYDLWVRLSDKGIKMYNIPEYLLAYRVHPDNSSFQRSLDLSKRSKIPHRALANIDIFPTEEEVSLLNSLNDILSKSELYTPDFMVRLRSLIYKIWEANKKKHYYDSDTLAALLWFRWIYICIKTKQYGKILTLSFVRYPAICTKLFVIIKSRRK